MKLMLVEGRGFEKNIISKKNYTLPNIQIEKIKPVIRAQSEIEYKILDHENFRDRLLNFMDLELQKRDNFFYQLADNFGKQFHAKYNVPEEQDATISNLEHAGIILKNSPSQIEDEPYPKALREAKSFKKFLMSCIKNFIEMISFSLFNNDSLVPSDRNLHKIACKILFGRGECYISLFELMKRKNIEEESKLQISMKYLQNLSLEEFKVRESLRLVREKEPYQAVIDTINYLNVFHNPYEKINLILRVRKEIAHCIDEYTTKYGSPDGEKITITAEEIANLFRYCLVKSGNTSLKTHQNIIEEFVEERVVKFDDEGYYFSVYASSLDLLISISANPKILLGSSS
jgi:hypothetical protein